LGITLHLVNSRQKLTVSDESLIETALKQTPKVAVRNADGSFDGRIRMNMYRTTRLVWL
jgi:hypothetical protein